MRRLLVQDDNLEFMLSQMYELGYTDTTFYSGGLPFAPWILVDITNHTFKRCRYSVSPGTYDFWHVLRFREFKTILTIMKQNISLKPYIDSLNKRYKGYRVTEFPTNP